MTESKPSIIEIFLSSHIESIGENGVDVYLAFDNGEHYSFPKKDYIKVCLAIKDLNRKSMIAKHNYNRLGNVRLKSVLPEYQLI